MIEMTIELDFQRRRKILDNDMETMFVNVRIKLANLDHT